MQKYLFINILILLNLLSLSVAGAENRPVSEDGNEKAVYLEEIIVTSNSESIGGTDILPDRTSVYLPAYNAPKSVQTVYDVLETMAGIDIQRGDFALSDDRDVIKIRGLGGRRMMVRIDGRPVRNAGGFGDTMVDWTSLSVEGIEQIQVIRGAHSAVFGETLGGTVNIITKKRKFKKEPEPEIIAEGGYSADNTQLFKVSAADTIKGANYVFAGGYRASDGYLRNSDYDIRDFAGRFSYNFPFDGRLSLGYKISDQHKRPFAVNDPSLPDFDSAYPVVPMEAFESPFSANYPGGKDYYNKKTQYADLIVEQNSAFGDWKIHLYHSSEKRDAVLYQFAAGVYYDNLWKLNYEDYGWILQDQISLNPSHHITLGFEGKKLYGKYYTENPFRSEGYDRERWMTHLAGYLEYSWQVSEAMEIILGLRYDRADMNLPMSDFEDVRGEWSPKSGLNWNILPDMTGFVYVSKAFRIPTAMEYGWSGYPTGEHLKNETAMEYEAGIIKKFGTAGSCRFAYYYYDIENYILFNEALNPRTAELAGTPVSDSIFNADHVKLQGIETEVSFQLSATLNGYFNYTYHDLQMRSAAVSEGVTPPDIYRLPRHTINAGIRWSPLQNTKIMVSMKYSDERKTSRGETVGRFWIADTGFEQCFWNKKLKISGYVNNLFDKTYEEKYSIPAPERRLGIRVSYLY